MLQRFAHWALLVPLLLAGCDSVLKNPPGAERLKPNDSANAADGYGTAVTDNLSNIVRPTERLLPEEDLPAGPVQTLDDLYGWLAWQLQEVADSEQHNNQLALIETVRKFNERLKKIQGMRVRIAVPIEFVGENERGAYYNWVKLTGIGLPLPATKEEDYLTRLAVASLTTFRPISHDGMKQSPVPNPFHVTMRVTPFAAKTPPYRVRFADANIAPTIGVSAIGKLFTAAQAKEFTAGKTPVLEGRIHFAEYDMDLPTDHGYVFDPRRRLSLVLSSVKVLDERPATPLFDTFFAAQSDALQEMSKSIPFHATDGSDGRDKSKVASGEAHHENSGPLTFRIAKVTPDGAVVEPWTFTRKQGFSTDELKTTWHWRFNHLPILTPKMVAEISPGHPEVDLLPVGLMLSSEQLAALKPGGFLTVNGTLQMTTGALGANPELVVWLNRIKPLGIFAPDGTPMPLPPGTPLPPAEAERVAKIEALVRTPLPPAIQESPPRVVKQHTIQDFGSVMRYLSGDLARATTDKDPVAYRTAYDDFLRRVEPLLGCQLQRRVTLSAKANHVEISPIDEEHPYVIPPEKLSAYWSSAASRIAVAPKSEIRVVLHPFVTTQDRPSEPVQFQLLKEGDFSVGHWSEKGLTAGKESFTKLLVDRDIDDATFQTIAKEGFGIWEVAGTLHSIVPWYPNFLDQQAFNLNYDQVHFIVVITRAQIARPKRGLLDCKPWWNDCFRWGTCETLQQLSPQSLLIEPTRNQTELERRKGYYEDALREKLPWGHTYADSLKERPRLITLPVANDDGVTVHCKPWRIVLPARDGGNAAEITLHCQLTRADDLPPKSPRDVPAHKALPALDMLKVTDSPLRIAGKQFAENDLVTFIARLEGTVALPFDWDEGRPHMVYQFTGARLIDHLPQDGEFASAKVQVDTRSKAQLQADPR